MTISQRCPFCESHDLRSLTGPGLDVAGYRCHDCSNTFYVAAVTLRAEVAQRSVAPDPVPSAGTRPTPVRRKRARRPS
jgi:hypothetical protein